MLLQKSSIFGLDNDLKFGPENNNDLKRPDLILKRVDILNIFRKQTSNKLKFNVREYLYYANDSHDSLSESKPLLVPIRYNSSK